MSEATRKRIYTVPDVPAICPGCGVECLFHLIANVQGAPSPVAIHCACGATVHVEPGHRPTLDDIAAE